MTDDPPSVAGADQVMMAEELVIELVATLSGTPGTVGVDEGLAAAIGPYVRKIMPFRAKSSNSMASGGEAYSTSSPGRRSPRRRC